MLSQTEYNKITNNTNLCKFFRKLVGSKELLQGEIRYCLYLTAQSLEEALTFPEIKNILDKVKNKRKNINNYYRFCTKELNINTPLIVIPRICSSKRYYIPISLLSGNYAFNDQVQIIENPTLDLFAFISSKMHMIWLKKFAGRLKNDFRYSTTLCYNTFPIPKISEQQKKQLELRVQEILRIREKYSEKTMAELYDPDKMPKDLLDAHHSLDMVIESCYRKKPFENDEQRLAHLFKMYEMMTNNASEEELKQLELGV